MYMNLNFNNWAPFKVSNILSILNGRGITTEEINDNPWDFIVVQSWEEDNWVLWKIDLEYCKEQDYVFSEKMCLTVARTWTAGFVSFQIYWCVVWDSAKILLLDDNVASKNRYLFIQAVLTANRYKYSYWRKVTEDKYMDDLIDLPIKIGVNWLPIIDDTYKYSEKWYIPDREFMEDYIKTLHYKPITTKNANNKPPELDISARKEFFVWDLFPKRKVTHYSSIPEIEWDAPFISSTSKNNWVATKVDEPTIPGNCITVSTNWDCFDCFYHEEGIVLWNDAEVLYNRKLNKYIWLFICTVMSHEKYRWAYWRKPKNDKVYTTLIKLPIKYDKNWEPIIDTEKEFSKMWYIPDREFMENYIKNLPYWDRI